jgi:hypothetical protein
LSSSGLSGQHHRPEKEKGGSSAIAEETAHFPTTHYKAKALLTCQVPPVIGAQDKQSMTPCMSALKARCDFSPTTTIRKNDKKTV